MTARNIFGDENSIKFNLRYKADKDCLEYLAEVKWLNGYILILLICSKLYRFLNSANKYASKGAASQNEL
jgi:hypothetical protein